MTIGALVSGLRVRSILILLLAILPTLGAHLWMAWDWRAHEVSDMHADALGVARHAATLHDRTIRGAADVLSSLAHAPALLEGDPRRLGEALSVVREQSRYHDVGVIAPDGTVLHSAAGRMANVRTSSFFTRAVETKRFAVGDCAIDAAHGPGGITVAHPVLGPDGSVRHVLFALMDVGWIAGVAAQERLPGGTTVTVFDSRGRIVARQPDASAHIGRSVMGDAVLAGLLARTVEDTAVGPMADGRTGLFGYVPLDGLAAPAGLHVAVAVPASAATSHADQILVRDLTGFGLAVLAALGMVWFGTDLLFVRRLHTLVQTTRRLSEGDMSARTGLPHGPGELNFLAGAFDEMAATLQHRQDLIRRQTERLAEQERRFRALIENSSDGIVLLDARGTVRYASPSTQRILGYEADQLVGVVSFDLVHPDDVEAARRRLALVAETPEAVDGIDIRLRHGDGSWRWIGAVARNLLDEPSVGAIITNYRDITAQRIAEESLRTAHREMELRVLERTAELRQTNEALQMEIADRVRVEETLRKLSRAIEQTADKVIVTDRNGVIEYVNPAAERLTGFGRDELVGRTPRLFNSGRHDAEFFERLWSAVLAGHVFREVFVNRTKDGREYYEEQTITPIRDGAGTITHFVATGRDITRRKRTEEALRRLNDQFEHEADRIAGVLHDEAGQFLTAAHVTLADVARELAPPFRERLQDVRRHLDQVEEQLRRLSHELRPRILDDLGLVEALKFLAEGAGRRSGMAVAVETEVDGRFDPHVETAIYRLVQEALTNVAKHARAGHVTVALCEESRAITCVVRDDGVGFDAPAMAGRPGESNLGLIGIQDRLEAVGGTLSIDSVPGRGTELRALIPLES